MSEIRAHLLKKIAERDHPDETIIVNIDFEHVFKSMPKHRDCKLTTKLGLRGKYALYCEEHNTMLCNLNDYQYRYAEIIGFGQGKSRAYNKGSDNVTAIIANNYIDHQTKSLITTKELGI